jgi:hypothetical protein
MIRRPKLYLFSFSLFAYLFCAAGYIDTIDAEASVQAAKALLERGSLRIIDEPISAVEYTVKRDGQYSKMGLTPIVLYLPVVAAAKVLTYCGGTERLCTAFLISLVNPILTALLLLVLFEFFCSQGYSPSSTLRICLVAGFCTLLLPYSKTAHREILQAVGLTCFYCLASRSTSSYLKTAWLCGVCMAALLLIKQALLVPLVPALVFVCYRFRGNLRVLLPALFTCGLGAWFGWWFYWKQIVRAKSITGYAPATTDFPGTSWSHPFLSGLAEQFLGIQNGLLWYCPLVLVVVVAVVLKGMRRQWSLLDTCLLSTIVAQAALHAVWFSPTGEGPLGPRYLVAVLPMMVMLIANAPWNPGRFARLALSVLVLWSFSLQLVNTCVKGNQYFSMVAMARAKSAGLQPYPQWWVNLRLFSYKLQGLPEIYPAQMVGKGAAIDEWIDVRPYFTLQGMNFWWSHSLKANAFRGTASHELTALSQPR